MADNGNKLDSSLVEKGKLCVVVTNEVLQDIEQGRTDVADRKLLQLQRDAAVLANEAEKLADLFERIDEHYQEKDAELQGQIGDLGLLEDQEKARRINMETQRAAQQSILQDNQARHRSAEGNLQAAERKLREAEEEEKKIQVGATVAGVVVGLFTGGIGFAIGAAAGASLGAIVNACRDEEKDARSERNRRSNDVNRAASDVRSSESEISSCSAQIATIVSNIQSLQNQRCELHNKTTKIKAAIVILKKSTTFWLLFKQLSQHGEDRTALLRRIVEHANTADDCEVFQSSASERVVNTFIDSWESIAACAAEGCSNHMLSAIECADCKNECSTLPHLRGMDLVCSTCHLALGQ